MIDRVVTASGGGRTLEIGPATGVVTEQLVARGLDVTAIELGAVLADAARRNLGDRAEIVTASFDEWAPAVDAPPFDLVVAATSWHWLDPATKYDRAADLLVDDGHLVFWATSHVEPPDGDPVFVEFDRVFDRLGIGKATPRSRPGSLPERVDEIAASGRFEVELVEHVHWTTEFTPADYVELMRTFSDHIARPEELRRKLEEGLLDAAADRETITRGWGTVVHVARKR